MSGLFKGIFVAINKTDSAAKAKSGNAKKLGKADKSRQTELSLPVDAPAGAEHLTESPAIHEIPVDIRSWLAEAQLAWSTQQTEEERLTLEQAAGARVVYLADATMAGNTMTDAGSFLLAQNTVTNDAEKESERKAVLLPKDDGFNYAWLGLGLLGFAGGGGGGGGTQAPVVEAVHNLVNGSVVLGPVVAGNGLSVNVYAADGTTLLGTGVVSATGTFSVDVGSYTGVVIAKLADASTGADFIDEATGAAHDLTANLMTVGVASTGTVTLNINALTTIAAQKAGAVFDGASTGTITTEAINNANAAVADAFGLTDLTGSAVVPTVDGSGNPNPAYNPVDGLTNGEKYGAVLAALSGVDSANGGNMQTTISNLVAGLTVTGSTGTLAPAVLDVVIEGARAVSDTTSGTAGNSLTAVISNMTQQTSPSVSIGDVSIDDIVLENELATLTGTNASGATVSLTIGGHNVAATVTGATWAYTLTPGDLTAMGTGGETILATATLSGGGTAIATRSIFVDGIPVANQDTLAASEGRSITYVAADLLRNDTDSNGDTLTIASVTSGTGGTVVLNADGTVTFTPSAGFSGAASFTYTATDGTASSAAATVTVNVTPNGPPPPPPPSGSGTPVAVADTLAATEDTASIYAAADLLANDTDANGDTLRIASVISSSGGTAVLNGDGTVSFTPDADFNGAARFTYTASDGTNTSTAASVTVNVAPVNDTPVAIANTLAAVENTPVIYAAAGLLGNDTDADGDVLSIASVTSGAGGTAVLNGNGTVTFTPDVNFTGAASFTYTATDGTTTSNSATVTVNVGVDSSIYFNPSTTPFHLTAGRDVGIPSITVISSVSENVSLDVGPNQAATANLASAVVLAQATADDSSAALTLNNASGTITTLGVEASGGLADASATINSNGSLTISAVNVEVSGDATGGNGGSSASVSISGGVTLGDFITVTASGQSAQASFSTNSADAVVFTNVPNGVTVTASSAGAAAFMDVYNASGTISSILVDASGVSADAKVSIDASGTLNLGAISLSAAGTSADADANLIDVNLNNSVLTITADSASGDALASLDLDHVTGTITGITVTASGNGPRDAAALYMHGTSDVTINGDITLLASGSADSVQARLGDNEGTTIALGNSAITVTASGESAEAGAEIYNASGTAGVITLLASGDSANASLYMSGETGASLDIASLAVESNGQGSSTSTDIRGNAADLTVGSITVRASGDASNAYLFLSSDSNGSMAIDSLTITASSHDAWAKTKLEEVSGTIGAIAVNATGTSAEAILDLSTDTQALLTIDSISVIASGNATGSNDTAKASADIFGAIQVNTSINVAASGMSAAASLNLPTNGANFDNVTISVTASSEDASAALDVPSASGVVSTLSVTASGNSADATANFDNSSDFTITDSLTVSATAASADASLSINSDGKHEVFQVSWDSSASAFQSGETYTLTVMGDSYSYTLNNDGDEVELIEGLQHAIEISGLNRGFHLENNGSIDGTFHLVWDDYNTHSSDMGYSADSSSSDIAMFSDGTNSIDIGSSDIVVSGDGDILTFDSATVTVTANEPDAIASLDITHAIGAVTTLTGEGDGNGAYVEVNISGEIHITDALVVTGSNVGEANVYLGAYSSYDSGPVFDTASVSLTASSKGDANLEAKHASGIITTLAVSATGDAASGDASGANASFSSVDGQLTIDTSITVTANGFSADAGLTLEGGVSHAILQPLAWSGSIFAAGTYTLTVDGTDYSHTFSTDANEALLVNELQTLIDADANAHFHLETGYSSDNGAFRVVWDDYLKHSNDFVTLSDGTTSVTASLDSDGESSLINLDGITITVSATGASAEANLDISGASGTVTTLNVSASGYIAGSSGDITAQANVNISGEITLTNTLTITASDGGSIDVNLGVGASYDLGTQFDTATLSVTATNAAATLGADLAHGTLNSITVSAMADGLTGYSRDSANASVDFASSDLYNAGNLTVGDITVEAEVSGYASSGKVTFGAATNWEAGDTISLTFTLRDADGVGTPVTLTAGSSGASLNDAVTDLQMQLQAHASLSGPASFTASSNILNFTLDPNYTLEIGNYVYHNADGDVADTIADASIDSADTDSTAEGDTSLANGFIESGAVGANGHSADASLTMGNFTGRHAVVEIRIPTDPGNPGALLATGIYTLHLPGALEVNVDMIAGLQNSYTLNGTGLGSAFEDRLAEVDPYWESGVRLVDTIQVGNEAIYRFEFTDYAYYAGNEISITGPGALSGGVDGVVTQYAEEPARTVFNNSTILLSAYGTEIGNAAKASLDISQASGSIDGITVTADGGNAYGSIIGGNLSIIGAIDINGLAGNASLMIGVSQDSDGRVCNDFGGVLFSSIAVSVVADDPTPRPEQYDASASFDATGVTGTLTTLTVQAGSQNADASVAIGGDYIFSASSLGIVADGDDASASVHLYGGYDGDADVVGSNVGLTNAGGLAITLTASGIDSYASLDLGDATGHLGAITVTASGTSADASADIDFSGTLHGSIVATASGDDSNAAIELTAGSVTNVVVKWRDETYRTGGNLQPGVAFASGQTYTLTVGAVTLSYTLLAGDIGANDKETITNLVAGWMGGANAATYANAGFTLQNPNNVADFDGTEEAFKRFHIVYDDATAIHRDDISLFRNGVDMRKTNSDYLEVNYTDWGFDEDGTGVITLVGNIDLSAAATGAQAEAGLVLDNLVGTVDAVTVQADGGPLLSVSGTAKSWSDGASADLNLRLTGGITTLTIDAAQVRDVAFAAIEQSVQGGIVTVSGDGDTWLTLGDQTVDSIALAGLHAGGADVWGSFKLNLSMADDDLNAASDPAALSASLITITDFDAVRDSINLFTREYGWRYEWMQDVGTVAVGYAENENPVADWATYLADANTALDAQSGPGYYFGMIGGNGYLAFDKDGAGITGVIKLDGITRFDRINVADRQEIDLTPLTAAQGGLDALININQAALIDGNDGIWAEDLLYSSTAAAVGYNADAASWDVTTNLVLEGVSVRADSYYASGGLDTSGEDHVTLKLTESGGGDIRFVQSVIDITAYSTNTYIAAAETRLNVEDARGEIEKLRLYADGAYGDASVAAATFTNFDGVVNIIDLEAEGSYNAGSQGSAELAINGLNANVASLHLSADLNSSITASIGFDTGYVEHTFVELNEESNAIGHQTSATLTLNQAGHGGEVMAVATHASQVTGNMDITFNLTYEDDTADTIRLGYLTEVASADVFVAGQFNGTFNLTLNAADADTLHTDAALQTAMLSIVGWDSGAAFNVAANATDDMLTFGANVGDYEESLATESSLANFLATADTQLDGTTDYYFGVVGNNGYLAYDQDGSGVTLLIEFLDLTTFDHSRITGATGTL